MKGGKLLIILLALLVLVGCGGGKTTTTQGVPYPHSVDYLLNVEWESGSPLTTETTPYAVGESIELRATVENHGPELIPKNKIVFRLLGESAEEKFFKGGRTQVFPKDDIDKYDFTLDKAIKTTVDLPTIKYTGAAPVKTSKEIQAAYCYEMPVKVSTRLVLTDNEENIPGGASGNQIATGDNPSADVKVITLQQNPVKVRQGQPGTMDFYFTIKNVGGGSIRDSLVDCFEYVKQSYKETVSFTLDSAYTIKCDDTELQLTEEGEKTVHCRMENIKPENINDKTTTLYITLSKFAYKKEISPVTLWIEGESK